MHTRDEHLVSGDSDRCQRAPHDRKLDAANVEELANEIEARQHPRICVSAAPPPFEAWLGDPDPFTRFECVVTARASMDLVYDAGWIIAVLEVLARVPLPAEL